MHASVVLLKVPNNKFSVEVNCFTRDNQFIAGKMMIPFTDYSDAAMKNGLAFADTCMVRYTTHNGYSCYDV